MRGGFPIAARLAAGSALAVILMIAVAVVTARGIGAMSFAAAHREALETTSIEIREVVDAALLEQTAIRGFVATGDGAFRDDMNRARKTLQLRLATLRASDQTSYIPVNQLEQIDVFEQQIEDGVAALDPAQLKRVDASTFHTRERAEALDEVLAAFHFTAFEPAWTAQTLVPHAKATLRQARCDTGRRLGTCSAKGHASTRSA